MRLARPLRRCMRLAVIATRAPSAANANAVASPIPEEAPVTKATFPFSLRVFMFVCSLAGRLRLDARAWSRVKRPLKLGCRHSDDNGIENEQTLWRLCHNAWQRLCGTQSLRDGRFARQLCARGRRTQNFSIDTQSDDPGVGNAARCALVESDDAQRLLDQCRRAPSRALQAGYGRD